MQALLTFYFNRYDQSKVKQTIDAAVAQIREQAEKRSKSKQKKAKRGNADDLAAFVAPVNTTELDNFFAATASPRNPEPISGVPGTVAAPASTLAGHGGIEDIAAPASPNGVSEPSVAPRDFFEEKTADDILASVNCSPPAPVRFGRQDSCWRGLLRRLRYLAKQRGRDTRVTTEGAQIMKGMIDHYVNATGPRQTPAQIRELSYALC